MSNFSDGGRNMNNRYLAALGAALLLALPLSAQAEATM